MPITGLPSFNWSSSRKGVGSHPIKDAMDIAPVVRKKPVKKSSRWSRPPSPSNKSWLRSAIGILVFLEIILLGGHAVRWAVTSPRFVLREVDVVGHKRLDPKILVKLAGLTPGMNLFGVDLEKVRRRVESNPWIRRTSVRKIPPSVLRIEIEERLPVAVFGRNGGVAVDAEGVVLGKYSARSGNCLPFLEGFTEKSLRPGGSIYGDDIEMALRATSLFENGFNESRGCLSISKEGRGRLRITKPGGKLTLLVGEDRMEAQAARFLALRQRILKDQAKYAGSVLLDLTFPGRIIVRPMKMDGGLKG